jgi:hypothetical protein
MAFDTFLEIVLGWIALDKNWRQRSDLPVPGVPIIIHRGAGKIGKSAGNISGRDAASRAVPRVSDHLAVPQACWVQLSHSLYIRTGRGNLSINLHKIRLPNSLHQNLRDLRIKTSSIQISKLSRRSPAKAEASERRRVLDWEKRSFFPFYFLIPPLVPSLCDETSARLVRRINDKS